MATVGEYWEPALSRAQGAHGKSRATGCGKLSSRTGPAERDIVGSVGSVARYVSGSQQWSAMMKTGTDAEIGAQGTWKDLLSRVGSAPAANPVEQLNAVVGEINAGTNIRLIEVFSLQGAPAGQDRARALRTPLTAGADMRTAFLNAVSASPAVVNKLAAGDYVVSDVVDVTKSEDGTFLIYVVPPKAGEALPGALRTRPTPPDYGPAGGIIEPRLGDMAG
jgi:hypothetical protein